MTRNNINLEIQQILNTYRGENGETIGEIPYETRTFELPDGTEVTITRTVHQQTADGELHNPLHAIKDSSQGLAVCSECPRPRWRWPKRDNPQIGWVHRKNAHRCAAPGCARLLCGRHSYQGADGFYRCLLHHRLERLLRIAHWIFYKHEEP